MPCFNVYIYKKKTTHNKPQALQAKKETTEGDAQFLSSNYK